MCFFKVNVIIVRLTHYVVSTIFKYFTMACLNFELQTSVVVESFRVYSHAEGHGQEIIKFMKTPSVCASVYPSVCHLFT